MSTAPPQAEKPTVYFDGACPVCAREIAFYRGRPGAEALSWVDAAACPAPALGGDLDRDQALDRMHVRLADGTLVSGAAAFAVLWQATPGFRWLGRAVAAPGLCHLAEAAYLAFQWSRRLGRFRRRSRGGAAPSASHPISPD